MTEYIDRNTFITEKREQYCRVCDRRKGMKNGKLKFCYEIGGAPCRSCGVDDALSDIEDYPAADVKPVVHGRWIEYPDCLKYPNAYADDHIVCSVCEECFSILDNDTARFWFCPHCGADLREG